MHTGSWASDAATWYTCDLEVAYTLQLTSVALFLVQRFGGEEPLSPHVLVAAGALAGLAASTATFPLEVSRTDSCMHVWFIARTVKFNEVLADFPQVVRRRMMAGAAYPSVTAAIRTIAAEEGWQVSTD